MSDYTIRNVSGFWVVFEDGEATEHFRYREQAKQYVEDTKGKQQKKEKKDD